METHSAPIDGSCRNGNFVSKLKVVVFDMQPITPAIGGGRQRLLGIFHALGEDIETIYVGSYDWPGEAARDLQVTPGLREICVPLSAQHHAEADKLAQGVGGTVVIDAAFSIQAQLSPEWMAEARKRIEWADVVVFEHPWAYSPLKSYLKRDQLLVYDAQNVESFLKAESLGFEGVAGDIVNEVARNEYDLLVNADLVLCCSEEDSSQFSKIFEIPESKLRIAPNGAFTRSATESIALRRMAARSGDAAEDTRPVAVFMGSQYGPNADAARFIVAEVAPVNADMHFVLIGSVSETLSEHVLPNNVTLTGVVSDEERDAWLLRADIALNPMNAGSGTNVKMFDYLAAGLPVLTTAIGARGICDKATAPSFLRLVQLERFSAELPSFFYDQMGAVHAQAWDFVDSRFSWEGISAAVGDAIAMVYAAKQSPPTMRETVLILCPWNIRCGIGEHSAYLADGFRQSGHEVVIYGNRMDGHPSVGFELELGYPVVRGWVWDNQTWCDSRLDQERYREVLSRVHPTYVVVQHHSAYMPAYDYGQAVRIAKEMGASVIVEAHDARNLSNDAAAVLTSAGAALVVHDESERAAYSADVADAVRILHLPVYSRKKGAEQIVEHDPSAPVISGFGFLRPYKGVHIAIEAIALIRKQFPNVRYKGWHALYPGSESQEYYKYCVNLAKKLGIQDAVSLETDFVPIEDVVTGLALSSLVLLPYEPSREGASAAANIAVAAGRPLVVSQSLIFRPLAQVVITAAEHKTAAYAHEVISLLKNERRARKLADAARRWAEDNSYVAAASQLLKMDERSNS